MAEEVEETVGGSCLGERLGELMIANPISSSDIGSGSESLGKPCCSTSNNGGSGATLEAEEGNRTDGRDTHCELVMEDVEVEGGHVDINPETGNVSSLELGLSRISFNETQQKHEVNPCSSNQVDDGKVPSEVLLHTDSAPSGCTTQNELGIGGDNSSVKSIVKVATSDRVTRVVDDKSGESLVMPDEIRLTGAVAALNMTDVVESSDPVEKEEKGNVKTDDSVCETKCPDVPLLSLRRSSRARKTLQQVQGGKQATNGRKKVATLSRSATIDLLSKATRKKRSCLSRSFCSSDWGLSGKLSKYFELSNEVSINEVLDKGPKKGKSAQRSRKKVVASSQYYKETQVVTCRPIRLKVTFGKKEEKMKVDGISPVGIDALSDLQPLSDGNQPDLCSYIERTGVNVVDGSIQKETNIWKRCSNSVENIQFTGTDFEICSMLGKSTDNDSAALEPEKQAGSYADKFLDPGTSPDSEVIDQVLDSAIGTRNLTLPVNTSDGTADPGKASSPPSLKRSKKKKNKKDKLCPAGNPGMEDKLLCQAGVDKDKVSDMGHQWQKINNGFGSTNGGITAPSENPSSNTSGSELISMEVLSVSDEVPLKAPGLDNCADSNICSGTGAVTEVADSGNSCQLLPPDETPGKRHSRSSKAKGKSRNKSKVTDSTRNRKEPSGQSKVNRRKLGKKSKVNDNGILNEDPKEADQLQTGNCVVVNVGKANTSHELAPENLSCQAVQPAKVGEEMLLPRIAWVCCDDCHKWRCIPARLADAIEESNCRWTCKDNQDQAFADCSIPQEKSNADINAELQISDEEDARGNGTRHAVGVSQPSTWMLIKSNLFLHRSRKTQTMDEIMVCHCKPPADGSLGCGNQCLNRMLNIECVQGTCPCGDLCSNQQFQRRRYAKLSWFRCGRKGYGLQVLEDISKGQFLIEYVGEVLDLHSYETRQKEYASKGHKHFYFMTLNGSEVIDACAKGNLGRFVNHSCDPNCRTEKWVVNGEICVGLFALRNIRKGEELTFDYNYVRVFGAAAKKCHCGSAKCRGYIGGDPLNAEVIVQGDSDDEFPEPVVVNECGEIDHTLENMMARNKPQDIELVPTADNVCEGDMEVIMENRDILKKMEKSPNDVLGQTTLARKKIKEVPESSDNLAASQIEDLRKEPVSAVDQSTSSTEQTMSSCKSQADVLPEKVAKKSLCGSIDSNSRMSAADTVDCEQPPSKPRPRMKISRPVKSIKNRKCNSNAENAEKAPVMTHRSQVLSHKPRKLVEGSANCHLEAVEEKLNELLDADGGICKRKDASRGYLKLLLLTAASGDSCNGGAIQSNRDLSMVLDAMLKTKSRGVLVDIINNNGLQMLHNMMKLYRKDFKKIPILRKLLKVLEFLADRGILTVERINGDPLHPGVESFRESILSFTEHTDKKVHQIARNFRDRWIRRSMRKFIGMEKTDRKREFNRSSNPSRFFGTHQHWRDHGLRPTEPSECSKPSAPIDTEMQEAPGTHQHWQEHGLRPTKPLDCSKQSAPIDAKMQEVTPQLNDSQTIVSRPRKRKSRWDQPADPVSPRQSKEQRTVPSLPSEIRISPRAEITGGVSPTVAARDEKNCSVSAQNLSRISGKTDDMMWNSEDGAPPGFSTPQNSEGAPPGFCSLQKSDDAPPGFSSLAPHNSTPVECSSVVSVGRLQERFNSHLPVAYGMPFCVMQQSGTPQSETVDSWVIAPAMPFQPFPPLPPYPRDESDCPQPCTGKGMTSSGVHEEMRLDNCLPGDSYRDQGTPSTSGAGLPDMQNAGTANQHVLHQERGFPNSPGRRYYRHQRWNHLDQRAPWIRKKHGWGFKGNHPRNGAFNLSMERIATELSGQRSADVHPSVDYTHNC